MATKKNRISISLSDKILKQLESMAKKDGMSKSTLITILIMDEYARRRKPKRKKTQEEKD